MNVALNCVYFGSKKIRYRKGDYSVIDTFDDNNNLLRRVVYDSKGRDVDCFEYNNSQQSGHQHKEYTSDGCIETYKSPTQQYTRQTKTFVKGSYTHHTDKFISKTSPKSNYFNDFVRDVFGNLVKIINNGKVMNFK